jgi:hypothetical protein
MPISLGGTIAVLAVDPGLAAAYAWVAVIGIPLLAIPALAVTGLAPEAGLWSGGPGRWLCATAAAAVLLAVGWGLHGHLVGQAAAVALTCLSACTLASFLAALAPVQLLKVGLVTMAVLDAILVFGQLLQGPNSTLEAASPGAYLPHLQIATFGTAVIGYGDVFVAAVLGNIVVGDAVLRAGVRRWQAALTVLVCAAAFDALFLVLDVLPATVPVAVALLLLTVWVRRIPAPVPESEVRATRAPGGSTPR